MSEEKNSITINTTKFGEIEVNKDSIFNFVTPIIGFKELKEYTLVDYKPESQYN